MFRRGLVLGVVFGILGTCLIPDTHAECRTAKVIPSVMLFALAAVSLIGGVVWVLQTPWRR